MEDMEGNGKECLAVSSWSKGEVAFNSLHTRTFNQKRYASCIRVRLVQKCTATADYCSSFLKLFCKSCFVMFRALHGVSLNMLELRPRANCEVWAQRSLRQRCAEGSGCCHIHAPHRPYTLWTSGHTIRTNHTVPSHSVPFRCGHCAIDSILQYFSQKHLRCLGSRLVALAARERYGSDERVDGGEAVGSSLGRAPLGRSDTEATRGWTES